MTRYHSDECPCPGCCYARRHPQLPREVAAAIDTRPRFSYRIPSGEVVSIIFDHGETPPFETTFTLAGGSIVTATRCAEPVEIHAGPVLYTLTDDGLHGFTWTASRMGVLTSKGWIRTRSAKTAELAAKAANSTAFAQDSWHPDRA